MLTRTKESTIAKAKAATAVAVAISLAKRPSVYLPLSTLIVSDDNVRNDTSPGTNDVAELAELIYSQSLLAALHVVAQLVDGVETGLYEVVAGGRRLRALQLLASQGRISADEEIECKVISRDATTEVSTAENSGRMEMHAADEVLAFKKMVDEGRTVEEVASRFGVGVKTVKRRLRLAHVAPKLLDLFRMGKASMEQMQALAISDDQEHQVVVWDSLDVHSRHPQSLRRRLLSEEVQTNDNRVKFVGLQAYKARGGTTRADLFSPGEQTFLTDVPLLDAMLGEKLEAEAEAVRAEGWRWVEVRERFDYSDRSDFAVLRPSPREATKAEAKEIAAAEARVQEAQQAMEAFEDNDSDDYDWKEERRLSDAVDAAESALSFLQDNLVTWQDDHKAVAGAVVTMDDGKLMIHRGFVRPEDRKATVKAMAAAGVDATVSGADPSRKEKPEMPERLVFSLTSQRTMALQAACLQNQHVALATLAHALFTSMRHEDLGNVAKVRLTDCRHRMESLAPVVAESRAAKEINAVGEAWESEIPEDNLFAWLREQPLDKLLSLLTFCTANSLDAIYGRADSRDDQADELAKALGLDMADWWKATPESYLGSVPKAKLVEAVTEAVSAEAARPIEAMKKDAAVAAAAQLLEPTRWLPKPLRAESGE